MTDLTELYDSEIAVIGKVYRSLMEEFSHKLNSRANLDELAKRAQSAFFDVGLIIDLDITPCILVNANEKTGKWEPGMPVLTVLGRVPGGALSNQEQNIEVMDHERKRREVIVSKERGEAFLGQKEKA